MTGRGGEESLFLHESHMMEETVEHVEVEVKRIIINEVALEAGNIMSCHVEWVCGAGRPSHLPLSTTSFFLETLSKLRKLNQYLLYKTYA